VTPRIIDRLHRDARAERAALVASLRARPATLPPKYFYDRLGAALYGAICELPEYYPTRTEQAIFDTNRGAIAAAIGTGTQLIDLGAGDGVKAESWFPHVEPVRYVALDIAAETLPQTLDRLSSRFPSVEVMGLVTDFTRGLDLAIDLGVQPLTFLYPGSSIGNFDPEESVELLRAIHAACSSRPGSGLLIGIDTKKEKARLDAAYDDALGVTALFNRNALTHVNRLIGSDFDIRAFAHRAFYAQAQGRVEMHLEALSPQAVLLDGETRVFDKGERIHTENSYKYAPDEFDTLLACAGFATVRRWQDAAGDFAVFWAA
jgi:dimethylhistidine N-methyltransferase